MKLHRVLRQKAHSAQRLLVRATRTWRTEGIRSAFTQLRSSLRGAWRPGVKKYVPSDFDLDHGVDTSGIVRISEMEIRSANYVHGVFYKASSPDVFERVMNGLNLPWDRFHFVDVGSGKGLVLLLAGQYPFRSVTGVEFAADLHQIAQSNIGTFTQKHHTRAPIQSVCADAAAFEFPSDPLVLYFYEPFEMPVLAKVVRNLQSSYAAHPREVVIIYHDAPSTSVLSEMRDSRKRLFAESGIFHPLPTVCDANHSIYQTVEASRLEALSQLSKIHAS